MISLKSPLFWCYSYIFLRKSIKILVQIKSSFSLIYPIFCFPHPLGNSFCFLIKSTYYYCHIVIITSCSLSLKKNIPILVLITYPIYFNAFYYHLIVWLIHQNLCVNPIFSDTSLSLCGMPKLLCKTFCQTNSGKWLHKYFRKSLHTHNWHFKTLLLFFLNHIASNQVVCCCGGMHQCAGN